MCICASNLMHSCFQDSSDEEEQPAAKGTKRKAAAANGKAQEESSDDESSEEDDSSDEVSPPALSQLGAVRLVVDQQKNTRSCEEPGLWASLQRST